MATTLSITDLGDGTGATATIAGSAGGSNVVYYQQVTAQVGAGSWTVGGSRTGDGTVPLSLPLGYYFAYRQTNAAGISDLCYFAVTSGLDAVMTRCFNAVKATLQLLNLPFTQLIIDSQYAGEQPLVKYPCTVITTEDANQTDESVVNGRDDLGNSLTLTGLYKLHREVAWSIEVPAGDYDAEWDDALNQGVATVATWTQPGSATAVLTCTSNRVRYVPRSPTIPFQNESFLSLAGEAYAPDLNTENLTVTQKP